MTVSTTARYYSFGLCRVAVCHLPAGIETDYFLVACPDKYSSQAYSFHGFI